MTVDPVPTFNAVRADFTLCPNRQEHEDFMQATLSTYIRDYFEFAGQRGAHSPRIGPEHPMLAATLVALVDRRRADSVLEIGYQCGGAAIPLGTYLSLTGGYYEGWDNHAAHLDPNKGHSSSMDAQSAALRDYFGSLGLTATHLHAGEDFDARLGEHPFDFVFMDHTKAQYLEALKQLIECKRLNPAAWVFVHDIEHNPAYHEAWESMKKHVLDNDLGECHELRDGFRDVVAYDCGLIVMKG
jgi:predicted O-methyltransferase YrrM